MTVTNRLILGESLTARVTGYLVAILSAVHLRQILILGLVEPILTLRFLAVVFELLEARRGYLVLANQGVVALSQLAFLEAFQALLLIAVHLYFTLFGTPSINNLIINHSMNRTK